MPTYANSQIPRTCRVGLAAVSMALASAAITPTAIAQSVVVPNAYASVPGTSQLNTIIRDQGNPRTYVSGVLASELAAVPPGSVLTGVSLRFSSVAANPATWPASSVTWASYDISIGPAAPFVSWVSDPSANFASAPQLVRSGPMTIDPGAFTNGGVAGAPNPWSEFYFDFQQPYTYLGGDLAMLFTHPGSSDASTAPFPETVPSDAASYGLARSGPGYQSTITGGESLYVMRVHYGFGAGCALSGGSSPVLVQNGDTAGGQGGEIRLQVANSEPGAPIAMALGFTQQQLPLGFGCSLLVSPDIVLVVGLASPSGRAVQTVSVPTGVTGSFFAQAAVLDAALPLGFAVSNGVSPAAF
ncbi:MAG: hypothetical protein AB8H80_20220 [Planctomycetota bacterium]